MKLTTFAFEPRLNTLEWKFHPVYIDEKDEPDCAIWETHCRSYCIVFNANSNDYSPRCFCVVEKTTSSIHRKRVKFCKPLASLEAAKQACEQHRKDKRNG